MRCLPISLTVLFPLMGVAAALQVGVAAALQVGVAAALQVGLPVQ